MPKKKVSKKKTTKKSGRSTKKKTVKKQIKKVINKETETCFPDDEPELGANLPKRYNNLINLVGFFLASIFLVYLIGGNPNILGKGPAWAILGLAAIALALILFYLKKYKDETKFKELWKLFRENLGYTFGMILVVFFVAFYVLLLIVYILAGLGYYG